MRALNANPHSLWHDIIVTNTESAANMKAHRVSKLEYCAVPASSIHLNMRADPAQARAKARQR
jgi:hypothetical protein